MAIAINNSNGERSTIPIVAPKKSKSLLNTAVRQSSFEWVYSRTTALPMVSGLYTASSKRNDSVR